MLYFMNFIVNEKDIKSQVHAFGVLPSEELSLCRMAWENALDSCLYLEYIFLKRYRLNFLVFLCYFVDPFCCFPSPCLSNLFSWIGADVTKTKQTVAITV